MARPTTFTQKLAARICVMIADGASLRSIGEMPTMPSRRTMRGWLNAHPEFERDYQIARRHRADALVDEIIEISDGVKGSDSPAAVNAARLAVVSRQWLAAKLLPQYADRQTTELVGANGRDLIPAEPDPDKLALALLTVLHAGPGGKNDPATLPARPATAATTLLSGPFPAEPAEPVPVPVEPEPVETEAIRREHLRWINLTGPRNWQIVK